MYFRIDTQSYVIIQEIESFDLLQSWIPAAIGLNVSYSRKHTLSYGENRF